MAEAATPILRDEIRQEKNSEKGLSFSRYTQVADGFFHLAVSACPEADFSMLRTARVMAAAIFSFMVENSL